MSWSVALSLTDNDRSAALPVRGAYFASMACGAVLTDSDLTRPLPGRPADLGRQPAAGGLARSAPSGPAATEADGGAPPQTGGGTLTGRAGEAVFGTSTGPAGVIVAGHGSFIH